MPQQKVVTSWIWMRCHQTHVDLFYHIRSHQLLWDCLVIITWHLQLFYLLCFIHIIPSFVKHEFVVLMNFTSLIAQKFFFFWDLKGFFVLYLDRCVPLPLHGHIQQSHHITQWAVWLAWSVMTKDNQLSAWECCWLNIVCRWIESLFSHLLLTAS